MADAALECRGLVRRFADVRAVDGVDLSVMRGECFGLLGPNGAGKTTTIEILEGLTEPDAGEVTVLGSAPGDAAVRARVGIALQETQLSEKLTVFETLRLFRSFYQKGRSVDDVITRLGLDDKRNGRVGKLSGGQKQRLALACALVGDPLLLFLDEPSTGLDPQARLKVWEIVQRFKTDGGTVLLTTHYMEEAARLCDRVGIMDHGKLIALGTPAELIARLGAPHIIEVETTPALPDDVVAALSGVSRTSRKADAWVLYIRDFAATLPAVLAAARSCGCAVKRMVTREATLEDVFVHLTGERLRDG